MRTAKMAVVTLISLMFISGCASNEPSAAPVVEKTIPANCETTHVLPLLQQTVVNAKYIVMPWQPAPGTELADVLDNGGIACTYGDQPAEIGVTVMWVKDTGTLYSNRTAGWTASDYEKVDLPGMNEESAYYLYKPQSQDQEFHVWLLNMKVDGVWIQLSSSMANSLEDGQPYLAAAVASLR